MKFLNDEKLYQQLFVPATSSSHNPDHLAKVNSLGGFDYLMSVIPNESKLCLEEGISYFTQNISPHGLGGLILWDSSAKHFFRLLPERQQIFWKTANKIRHYLMAHYGHLYDVVLGMCTADVSGEDAAQSIDYAHIHLSLMPREIGAHHGVILAEVVPPKNIEYKHSDEHTYDFQLSGCDRIISRSGVLFDVEKEFSTDPDFNPFVSFIDQNVESISWLMSSLSRRNGEPQGSSWVIVNSSHFGVSPGTPYFWLGGQEKIRLPDVDTTTRIDFEDFNKNVFLEVKQLF